MQTLGVGLRPDTGVFRDADASLSLDGELPTMGECCGVPAAAMATFGLYIRLAHLCTQSQPKPPGGTPAIFVGLAHLSARA